MNAAFFLTNIGKVENCGALMSNAYGSGRETSEIRLVVLGRAGPRAHVPRTGRRTGGTLAAGR